MPSEPGFTISVALRERQLPVPRLGLDREKEIGASFLLERLHAPWLPRLGHKAKLIESGDQRERNALGLAQVDQVLVLKLCLERPDFGLVGVAETFARSQRFKTLEPSS